MPTLTISSKGWVVIPAELRKNISLHQALRLLSLIMVVCCRLFQSIKTQLKKGAVYSKTCLV